MRGERLSAAAIGVAVFLAGGALLSLEIASSRVMAPYFGNSLFVWGALIGVVLAGLSVGYWVGGIVADRRATAPVFVGVLGLSALLVLAIPFVDGWILGQVVAWDPGPRLNPVVATIAIFGAPAVVLGTVSPIAVKLLARSLERLGRTAGRLFAVSTAGSIAGTFATAFFLIPELGTDQLIATAAVVLLLAAAAVSLVERLVVASVLSLAVGGREPRRGRLARTRPGRHRRRVAAPELVAGLSPAQRRGSQRQARRRSGGLRDPLPKDSRYHRIAVVDDTDSRYLRFDSSFQSGMYLDDPFETRFEYSDYLQLALAYNADARNVLFIGLGGGSGPKRTWRDFPAVRFDAVELDPDVVDVAYRFFELPRDDRLNVEVEDGRRYLVQNDGPWDVIVIDAFYSDSIPFHLATQEFLELARSRLAPGGVIVTNIIGAVGGSDSRSVPLDAAHVPHGLPDRCGAPGAGGRRQRPLRVGAQHDVRRRRGRGAVEAVPRRALARRAPALARRPRLGRRDPRSRRRPIPTNDVPVLTDDYAPTDALLLLFG